mmetsp:Transcript_6034/g.14181  ORF Transcript_6034/g.14181 Transcript_6034/m.14181 type:complete len:249 (-) Transcript_6034:57-803(-)
MASGGSGGGAGTTETKLGNVRMHAPGETLELSECLEEVRDALGTRYIHPETINECFAEFDKDGSGHIERSELVDASMRLIDLQVPGAGTLIDKSVMDKIITDTLSLLDTNADGRLDKKEFISMFTHSKGLDLVLDTDEVTEEEGTAIEHMRRALKKGTVSRTAVHDVFIAFDMNKSNFIERRELAKMTMRLLEVQYPDALDAIDEDMVDQALDDTMKKLDTDRDGKLNEDEFLGIFTHPDGLNLRVVD